MAERFGDFLDAHVEQGLGTIPTFVVGHMSGENWDPAWREGRDLYRDVWLVSQQAWLAAELAGRFGSHPAIVGWLVSNEMPLYGGPGTSAEITAWARLVVQAVRSSGATQPVSLGDGAWGVEVSGNDNGYSLRELAPLIDFVGPHVYPMQDDQVRQFLTAAFVCELSGGFGKPVVLEEFGVTSDFASDDRAADYYRQVLHTSLLAGAQGWIAWNNCDYDDLRDEDPYRHHPFEMHFGLTDRAGRPKPQLGVLAEFAALVERAGRRGLGAGQGRRGDRRARAFRARAALHHSRLPPGHPRQSAAVLRCGARGRSSGAAGAGARRSAHGSTADSRSVRQAADRPGIDRLRDLARDGATVYLSYFAGSSTNQRGPWLAWLAEIFGVRHGLRYGLVDPIAGDEAVLEFVRDFGDIVAGTRLRFAVAGEDSARAFLPVEPAGAEIVAVDGQGRPALLQFELGSGSTVLCTYPLEHMAARTPRVNPEDTWRLYSALGHVAGVARPIRVDDPRVLVGRVRNGATETTIFINCSSDTIEVEPLVTSDFASSGSPGTKAVPFTIDPFGVSVAAGEAVAAGRVGSATTFEHIVRDGQPAIASREGSDAVEAP